MLVAPEASTNLVSPSAWDRAGCDFVGGYRKLEMLEGRLFFPLKNNLCVQAARIGSTRTFIYRAERNVAQ